MNDRERSIVKEIEKTNREMSKTVRQVAKNRNGLTDVKAWFTIAKTLRYQAECIRRLYHSS